MDYEQIGINTMKLVRATEDFKTLMYFLCEQRGYSELNLKIGTFDYDNDWIGDIWCVLKYEDGIPDTYFKVFRRDIKVEYWPIRKLTDYCYGWDFETSEVDINFDIVTDFVDMLSDRDNDLFSEYHCKIHLEHW